MLMLEKIKKDLVEAMKAKDALKMGTIRMILASVHNEEIAKGKDKELTDEDIVGVIRKEAKKRREAIEIYESADRPELANKEKAELETINEYLPPELSEEEIQKIIDEVVSRGEENLGKVMGQVMIKIAGRAEPGKVSELVKRALENS
ncbi:MAG: glutamyl-tRNA amidotransferase [Candidatus Colwellbacteria bacterium CG10_big_fil_rev_8_21_14_0_10_42_22]|uniref:Glutamyl-tRNA amidotransferase n=1 Tax=Candidatus Colwellbacteria bacterium CG10_big_fil_rev_8_21_14_0_10_42_22 TaxID=1974540 RepID=A0A2H0VGF1_9BACT|nr:MAG: glutamyl-tRNA amidotransferase [Candidatus Colwellbacteria bacterium CG10_big_fil_rev_8_21_14_0_10_42_22]